jgi:hypothetical protein
MLTAADLRMRQDARKAFGLLFLWEPDAGLFRLRPCNNVRVWN